MRNRIIHFGEVTEDGTLVLYQRKTFILEVAAHFKKSKIRLILERDFQSRNQEQNGYYFAVIVPRICSALNRLGWMINESETHQMLAKKFLSETKENPRTGNLFDFVKSSADLSASEFYEYCEKVITWAAMELEEVIPPPDENKRKRPPKEDSKK